MPKTRRACRWRPRKPVRNEPLPLNPAVSLDHDDSVSSHELAEIERMLELMASAECSLGCDYSDGAMAPNGVLW